MKKQASSFEWRKVGAEVGAIVFAVLLALWLEGWREDVERQERADLFLDRIRAEISQNRENLQETIHQHEDYMAGLEAAIKDGNASIEAVGPFLQIEGSATNSSAWQSAKMSQSISQMPPEMVADLASIYDTQTYYANYLAFFFHNYTELATAIEVNDRPIVSARKFYRHLDVTNTLAEQLLRRYDAFLQQQSGN